MVNISQDSPRADKNTSESPNTANMMEEQRRLAAAAAQKAEEERQTLWAKRADVVYHFFAYRYFDRSATCLDLLNFSDADVDIFNLTANKARGLNNWYGFAEYLKKLDTPTLETNTQRRKFIYHVRSFNKTQAAHFRFYVRNLTADDVEYLEGLSKEEKASTIGEVRPPSMLIWATSCVEDEVEEEVREELSQHAGAIDHIEVAVDKCLEERRTKLRNDHTTRNAPNIEAIRDDLTKQFEQLAVNDGMREEIDDKRDSDVTS